MNLIICCTPLQVLIAERIINKYPREKFFFLMIVPKYSEKHEFYFKRLSDLCCGSKVIITKEYSRIFILTASIYVYFYFLRKRFKRIFIANIDDFIIQSILSRKKNSIVYTFDDGTKNISDSIYFSGALKENILKIIIRKIFNVDEDVKSIKKRSILHYTIYPEHKNIIDNITPIYLDSTANTEFEGSVSIFLGQKIFDDDELNKEVIERVIDIYGIEYYFPHPLDRVIINNATYIKTHMIFEDYFSNVLMNKRVMIYTFFSSAAINVSHSNRVSVLSIRPKNLNNNEWIKVYNLFEDIKIKVEYLN